MLISVALSCRRGTDLSCMAVQTRRKKPWKWKQSTPDGGTWLMNTSPTRTKCRRYPKPIKSRSLSFVSNPFSRCIAPCWRLQRKMQHIMWHCNDAYRLRVPSSTLCTKRFAVSVHLTAHLANTGTNELPCFGLHSHGQYG